MNLLDILFGSNAEASETTPVKQMANNAIAEKEIEEIGKTISAEAAGEGQQGMLAVTHVINNRMKNSGKSAIKVISAKNQFYGYTAKNRDKLYEQVKPTARKLAEDLYYNRLGKDITNGATYFRQPKEPIYSWHGEETVRIGNHIFHKERKGK